MTFACLVLTNVILTSHPSFYSYYFCLLFCFNADFSLEIPYLLKKFNCYDLCLKLLHYKIELEIYDNYFLREDYSIMKFDLEMFTIFYIASLAAHYLFLLKYCSLHHVFICALCNNY